MWCTQVGDGDDLEQEVLPCSVFCLLKVTQCTVPGGGTKAVSPSNRECSEYPHCPCGYRCPFSWPFGLQEAWQEPALVVRAGCIWAQEQAHCSYNLIVPIGNKQLPFYLVTLTQMIYGSLARDSVPPIPGLCRWPRGQQHSLSWHQRQYSVSSSQDGT